MHPHIQSMIRATSLACIASALVLTGAIADEPSKNPAPIPRVTERGSPVIPQATPTPSVRLYPGDAAPGFELDASNGKTVKLASLRGDWVALVFSDRVNPLSSLQSIDDELRRMGVKLSAVCREKVTRVRAQTMRDGLTFLIFADPTGQIGALYGLRDYGRSETMPAFLLLDRHGTVRLAVLGQPLSADEILQLTRNAMTGV